MTTSDDWLSRIRATMARGEYLLAYDLATTATAEYPDDRLLQYQTVLALARTGASDRALEVLESSGLESGVTGLPIGVQEDVAALRARIAKDRALALTANLSECRATARDAAEHYEASYRRFGRPYSCVNAATMWLVAGNDARATQLARDAQELLRHASPPDTPMDAYWVAATEAEIALLLDDRDAAAAALSRSVSEGTGDLSAVSTTRKQLLLICDLKNVDPDVLAPLAVPGVIHYGGHMISRPGQQGRFPAEAEASVARQIRAHLEEFHVGFAYGSLACGADILFAEALLERGAEVHVVLPFDTDEFARISVAPAGTSWLPRFNDCLKRATSVTHATSGAFLGDVSLFDYGARLAMGHALIRAAFLASPVEQVVVWDGRPASGQAGTARDVDAWRAGRRPTHVIAVEGHAPEETGLSPPTASRRVLRAMLFADVKGFSALPDTLTITFVNSVMGPLAETLARFDEYISHRNSWGDGLYVVLDDVTAAAHCALALQDTVKGLNLAEAGLPPSLGLRIGAHAGPIFEAYDPVRREPNFYGVEVTRTARIEPRTPEGDVYVTDPFAAMVALEAEGRLSCQYVGHIPTAKNYGTFPMYVLKHR